MNNWNKISDMVTANPRISVKKGTLLDCVPMEHVIPNQRYVSAMLQRPYNGGAKFQDGDVIFARITPCLQNRKIAQYKSTSDMPAFGSTEYFVFRAIPNVADSSYVYYLMKSDLVVETAINSMKGASGRQRAEMQPILNIEMNIPEYNTQVKIGKLLSAYDNLIDNNNRRIAILEEMAQRLYREWFVHFRFPGHENVPMVESELGMIPEGWDVGNISDNIKAQRKNISRQSLGDDTVYVGIEHLPRKKMIVAEHSYAESIKSSKLLFDSGNILFGKIRPYFHKIAIAPFSGCCSTDIIVLQLEQQRYAFDYLTLFSENFISFASQVSQGTKMPRAEWNVLKDYRVISPEKQIVSNFNDLVYPMIEQISSFSNRNAILRKTRDLLLPRLISGDIDVSKIDIPVEDVSR